VDLEALLREYDPHDVVIEVPSGKRGKGSQAGATGHLAIYGVAVGAVRRTIAVAAPNARVTSVDERTWTRGRSQRERVALAVASVSTYDRAADPGADVADAIGLGLWWLDNAAVATGGDVVAQERSSEPPRRPGRRTPPGLGPPQRRDRRRSPREQLQ